MTQFTVPVAAFRDALKVVGRAVSGKSTLQILNYILFTAENDRLALYGSDLEIWASNSIPCNIADAGRICVPAKSLQGMINTLPSAAEVTLTGTDKYTCVITCGKVKANLLGDDPQHYPPAREPKEGALSLQIGQAALKSALSAVVYAVGTDDKRANLMSVQMRAENGNALFTATDTHRMHLITKPISGDPGECLIKSAAAQELINALGDDGNACLSVDDSALYVELDDARSTQLGSSVVADKYPNWSRIIPADENSHFLISREELTGACARALLTADSSAPLVVLDADASRLVVSSKSGLVGTMEQSLDYQFSGSPIRIGLNGKYLIACLKAFERDTLRFSFTLPHKPCIVTDETGSRSEFAILMPMHLL